MMRWTNLPTTSLEPGKLRLIAVLSAVAALGCLYAGVTNPPSLHAPPAIMYVWAALLLIASLRTLELSTGEAGPGIWCGMTAFTCFSIIAWWMALSGDPSECVISGPVAFLFPHSGAVCRKIFIAGAAFFSLAPILYVWTFIVETFGGDSDVE
jgi:hypothetical protein